MADNVPVSNQLNINLSIILDDAVSGGADNGATAAIDGSVFSATKRNFYISQGCRDFIVATEQKHKDDADAILQGAVQTQSITLSSSGTTLNKDYMYPVKLMVSTQEFNYFNDKGDLDQDIDPYLDAAYTIYAGKLYGYQRITGTFTLLNSGSSTFYYIGAPRVNTSDGTDKAVNTTPDIVFDPRCYDSILLFSAARACNDKSIIDSDPTWKEKGGVFFAQAMAKLP